MCPNYLYCCSKCDHQEFVHYKLTETRPEIQSCEVCGELSNYQIAPPRVQQKVSYLDGQRSNKWKDLKEASKLNKAAAATDNPEEKKELQKEQVKIGYNFEKPVV